jgi:hypothetical protein
MRRAVILTAIVALIFLVELIPQMVAVEANPYNYISPYIFIESPDASPWVIYQTTSIPIEVEVLPAPKTNLVDLSYILDGGPNVKLSITITETSATYFGKGTLGNLTNGYHTVTALSVDSKGNVLSESTKFLVNTTLIFPALLLSPNNTTYYSKEIPLTYTINDPKYTVFYRLDNSRQTQLTGNTTLSGLSEGQHTITAHATDHKTDTGLYSKQTANFIIDTTYPTPTPSPILPTSPTATDSTGNSISVPLSTLIVVLLVSVIIIVSLLLLLYRRRARSKELQYTPKTENQNKTEKMKIA